MKTLLQVSSQGLSTTVRLLLGVKENGLNSFPKGLFLHAKHGKDHLWQWIGNFRDLSGDFFREEAS